MTEQNRVTLKDFIAKLAEKSGGDRSRVVSEDILEAFMEWSQSRGTTLYPAQEEAILELLDGKNVILNTPTGSGKSMVALALHFDSIVHGRKSVYTCPIKALVNEKWMALCLTGMIAFSAAGGALYRRRYRQSRRPYTLLHGRNFKQHGPQRGRKTYHY